MAIFHRFILVAIYIARIVASESANVDSVIESAPDVVVNTPKQPITLEQNDEPEADVPDVITPTNANDDADEACKANIAQLQAGLTTCQSKITSMNAAIADISDELSQTIASYQSCQKEKAQTSSRVAELQKDIETHETSLSTSRNDAQACREEVATCLSDYNGALQDHDTLKQKYHRIKGIHDRQSKELHDEIASLQSQIDKSKKEHKRLQNKYHDEREQVNDLEKVLRRMHLDATRTYVNTTLIMEDTVEFLSKSVDRSIVWTEGVMARKDVKNVQRKVVDITSPALSFARELYDTHAASHIHDLKLQLRDIDAVEGMRLFLVSVVEQVGKTGLDYLELTDDAVSKDSSRDRSRRRNRRNSRFRSIMEKKMKYAKRNGEMIVDQFFLLCIVILMFKVVKFFLVVSFRLISRGRQGVAKK